MIHHRLFLRVKQDLDLILQLSDATLKRRNLFIDQILDPVKAILLGLEPHLDRHYPMQQLLLLKYELIARGCHGRIWRLQLLLVSTAWSACISRRQQALA